MMRTYTRTPPIVYPAVMPADIDLPENKVIAALNADPDADAADFGLTSPGRPRAMPEGDE